MNLMESFIGNSLSGGSGQSGPSNAVLYTQQALTPAQQAQARENIGAQAEIKAVSVAGSAVEIVPVDKHVYRCGELRSLRVTDAPLVGSYTVIFSSGAAPTTTLLPGSLLGLEDFAAEANTIYELSVMDDRAVIEGWEAADHA